MCSENCAGNPQSLRNPTSLGKLERKPVSEMEE